MPALEGSDASGLCSPPQSSFSSRSPVLGQIGTNIGIGLISITLDRAIVHDTVHRSALGRGSGGPRTFAQAR